MATDPARSVRAFYDDLAATYDRIFPDWAASSRRQGEALHGVLEAELGPGPHTVLDCAAGIGTQLLGLAGRGHRVAGTDLSGAAVRRARLAGAARSVAVADMRALPVREASFDAVVCADNSLPHLLTALDVTAALAQMLRATRPGGLVAVSTRDYDALRVDRPRGTPAQVHDGADGVTLTLQLWTWQPDGERYDLEHLQLTRAGPDGDDPQDGGQRQDGGDGWRVASRRTRYWALTRAQLTGLARSAGLADVRWLLPEEGGGFYQPLMIGRRPGGAEDPGDPPNPGGSSGGTATAGPAEVRADTSGRP